MVENQPGKEREVIDNVYRILASGLDVRDVMTAVHSELRRLLDSERMSIVLFEAAGGFRYYAPRKENEAGELISGTVYSMKDTPFEQVLQKGLPLIVADTAKSNSWTGQKVMGEGILSVLVFPLEYKGKIFGAMNFGSSETGHFSEEHIPFLRQVAPGLSISIQNSLLVEEIGASEERYRTVVEGCHEGVIIVGDDYGLSYVNDMLAEITGYSREELMVMDFRTLLDEEDRKRVAEQCARMKRDEETPSRFELKGIRKDGEIRNVDIDSRVVKDSRGKKNTIAFVRDLTEKKRIEEQLVQTEKLRALGEMASGVAHDFNNALAVILGNTQLLLYTLKDEELRGTLQTIEKVAKGAAQTVRRLQDFTRKKTHDELFKLDVNPIVKDAVEITRPRWKDEAQKKGIRIDVLSNFEPIPLVEGNPSELREVITNIIFNAIEAMPEGGEIKIQTFRKRDKVFIQIADTGTGMTEEARKKAFEPFFTTKPFSNTGLGLSMSYGIIKRCGGDIEVATTVGRGTTFIISLPAAETEKESDAPLSIKNGKEARILLIDDEAPVRSVLTQILSQVNHQVKVARDGEEGIRLFKEKEFDIVLTDLGMPGLSGLEVCRAIKKHSPGTPVGMITGWGTEIDRSQMEETGLDFLISKPFDFRQVLKVVAETIAIKEKHPMS